MLKNVVRYTKYDKNVVLLGAILIPGVDVDATFEQQVYNIQLISLSSKQ